MDEHKQESPLGRLWLNHCYKFVISLIWSLKAQASGFRIWFLPNCSSLLAWWMLSEDVSEDISTVAVNTHGWIGWIMGWGEKCVLFWILWWKKVVRNGLWIHLYLRAQRRKGFLELYLMIYTISVAYKINIYLWQVFMKYFYMKNSISIYLWKLFVTVNFEY